MGDRYEPVWAAAAPYLRARKNDVHVPLSYGWAEKLLEAYPSADRDVVLTTIILHDCGWAIVDFSGERLGETLTSDRRRAHEVEGARIAREILGDSPITDEVCAIIDGHDTRLYALSVNDQLVKDADKLWRYTTVGVSIGCDFFAVTPAEYAGHVERELGDVLFTEEAVAFARHEIALTRVALRLDVLAMA
jgi:HD superfamily phosphodiesterase